MQSMMHKCIVVEMGKARKRKLSQKSVNLAEIGGNVKILWK